MKLIAGHLIALALFVANAGMTAMAAELTVDLGHGAIRWSTAELLARDDARTVNVAADAAFKRPMRYGAVPLADLLRGIAPADHLQFVGADGFAAEIPATLILNQRGSEAWLAIEEPSHAWPNLPGQQGSAGPFYVV